MLKKIPKMKINVLLKILLLKINRFLQTPSWPLVYFNIPEEKGKMRKSDFFHFLIIFNFSSKHMFRIRIRYERLITRYDYWNKKHNINDKTLEYTVFSIHWNCLPSQNESKRYILYRIFIHIRHQCLPTDFYFFRDLYQINFYYSFIASGINLI